MRLYRLLSFTLLKHIFRFLEEIAEDIFAVLFVLLAFEAGKLFEQFLLARREVSGRDNFNDDVLVAARAAVNDRDAHTLEAEGTVALRSRRNLERRRLLIDEIGRASCRERV